MRELWKRYWRWSVVTFGRAWVFWPVLACGAVLGNGWGPWGSVVVWIMALLVAGPGLAYLIHHVSQRRQAARVRYETPGS